MNLNDISEGLHYLMTSANIVAESDQILSIEYVPGVLRVEYMHNGDIMTREVNQVRQITDSDIRSMGESAWYGR